MSAPLICVRGLRWQFPQAPTPLFEALSFDLPGGLSCVCGDEGRGKSTLLRLLAGHLVAPAGSIRWANGPALQPDELRKQVAWYEVADPVLDQHKVQDILTQEVPQQKAQGALDALIEGLSLREHLGKPLYQLSTGSRRKVFIAATLARPSTVALLDQPGSGLDLPSLRFLEQTYARWAGQSERALLIADYQPPAGVACLIDLDRC